MQPHQLSYIAPRRECVETGIRECVDCIPAPTEKDPAALRKVISHIRTYHTRPWTLAGVLSTISGGGKFGSAAQHDFAPDAAEFAQDARIVFTDLMGGRYHNPTPERN